MQSPLSFNQNQFSSAEDPIKKVFQPHQFNKTHLEGSPDIPEFFKHSRHVFIMTDVGRPVYVRYGDEIKVSQFYHSKTAIFLATMNAILQKYLIFFSSDKSPQQLFKIIHHNVVIYFLQRKKMTLICSTKNKDVYIKDFNKDSEFLIYQMLEFLNSQLISTVTDNVNIQLASRPNYDPRGLLSGSKNILTLAVKNGINSPCITFNSICPVTMSQSLRAHIHTILKEQKNPSLLCTIIFNETMIIDICKKKDIDIKTDDILLIQTLVQVQTQLRKSQNWVPVCLPGLSALGMIQAYIYFFHSNMAIFMISDDNSHDMFFQLKDISNEIIEKFRSNNILAQINTHLDNLPTLPKCMEQPSSIKHFILKNDLGQIFVPQYFPFGKQTQEFKILMHNYSEKYKEFLQHTQNDGQNVSHKENYFSWGSDGFGISQYHDNIVTSINHKNKIMFCFDRLIDLQQVSQNVHTIQKMLKSDEIGNYFILKQY